MKNINKKTSGSLSIENVDFYNGDEKLYRLISSLISNGFYSKAIEKLDYVLNVNSFFNIPFLKAYCFLEMEQPQKVKGFCELYQFDFDVFSRVILRRGVPDYNSFFDSYEKEIVFDYFLEENLALSVSSLFLKRAQKKGAHVSNNDKLVYANLKNYFNELSRYKNKYSDLLIVVGSLIKDNPFFDVDSHMYRTDIYSKLINYYIDCNNVEVAKLLCEEAILLFPQDADFRIKHNLIVNALKLTVA